MPSKSKIITSNQGGLSSIVEEFIDSYFVALEGSLPASGLYDRVIQEVERPLLKATLQSVRGNQKKAAEILGINRNTLRKRLTELQIDPALIHD
ncbi:MAG: Fis family transcriptional regulator [Candidatus Paracaedibacteraceae bacterium]|nr:Fis family transcriptional regulator [Candidatus Paracaedibacteraceae bacterium]